MIKLTLVSTHEVQSDLYQLLLKAKRIQLRKGQNVPKVRPGTPTFYLLTDGFIKRFAISSTGVINVQAIFGPDEFFPLTPVFKVLLDEELYDGPEEFLYDTMTPAVVYAIEVDALKTAVDQNPLLYRDFMAVAAVRFRSNIQRLENIGLRSLYKRLSHQLLYLAQEFGDPVEEGILIGMPFTHQDLADMLSCSREVVTRELKKLTSQNYLSQNPRGWVVCNLPALTQISYS